MSDNHDPHFVLFLDAHVGYCNGLPVEDDGEDHEMESRTLRFDVQMPEPIQRQLLAAGVIWPPTSQEAEESARFAVALAVARMIQYKVGNVEGVTFVPTVEDLELERIVSEAIATFHVPEPKTREQMD